MSKKSKQPSEGVSDGKTTKLDPQLLAGMKAARQKKGLTQGDVAKVFDVQPSTISNWESGAACPSMDDYIAYCKFCGVNFIELLQQVYGDPSDPMKDFKCTEDEAELIRRYRKIDERGQRTVRRILDAEYNDALNATKIKES